MPGTEHLLNAYLELLRDLVQGESFESSKMNELVYPVRDYAPVVVASPEPMWYHFGYHSSTKGRYMRRGTCHIGETGLFDQSALGLGWNCFVISFGWGWDYVGGGSICFWLKGAFSPFGLGG
jgi:hypothetical protein